MNTNRLWMVLFCSLALFLPKDAFASVCAEVKLEINQELTLERQAFDAHMRIGNALANIPLENVKVLVKFTDKDGNPVTATTDPNASDALFFIRVDSMTNVSQVDGTGIVAPSTSADIHWLIIPSPGASKGVPSGTQYFVGATLSYTLGGEAHEVEVSPDSIFVTPMAELTLDYFLPEQVFGDDPLTPEVETSIPFPLGVRVKNTGFSEAKNLKIESAAPRIVDNERGLLVSFVIDACEVQGVSAPPTLLADFGSLPADASKVARWTLHSSLLGHFEDFSAKYSHSDALGGQLTSLIQKTESHALIHEVRVDLPGRDSLPDFLATDSTGLRIFESSGLDSSVFNASEVSTLQQISQNDSETRFTLSLPPLNGFVWAPVPDPFSNQKYLKQAIRSDGKILLPENAWLSKKKEQNGNWSYSVNLFDAIPVEQYTLVFGNTPSAPLAPVLSPLSDVTGSETSTLSLVVSATDPNGTIPALSAAPLPAGSQFTDQGNGSARLEWTPLAGQAGNYSLTLTASDGVLKDSKTILVTINPAWDTDGDGLRDDWEMQHFGSLARDGTGDFDGDGISDLDESKLNQDPKNSSLPPTPKIESPAAHSEITMQTPTFTIQGGADADGDPVFYEWQIFSNPELTDITAQGLDLPSQGEHRSWTLENPLPDNHRYFWRVRATDHHSYTLWVYGEFFVNTQNEAPAIPLISSPINGISVDTLRPVLEVTNSSDADEDTLTTRFEVSESAGGTPLISMLQTQGENGRSSWKLPLELQNQHTYFWRVLLTDEHGAVSQTEWTSFAVDLSRKSPEPPGLLSPAIGSSVPGPAQTISFSEPSGNSAFSNLQYLLECDTRPEMNSASKKTAVVDAQNTGALSADFPGLEQNQRYFFRVKASDGQVESAWIYGDFFVNAQNDVPSLPIFKNPDSKTLVETLTPTLGLAPAMDPDDVILQYRFEVYADAAMQTLLFEGQNAEGEFLVPSPLENRRWYFWRTRVDDGHGTLSPWSGLHSFFVKEDAVDDAPSFEWLEPAEDLITRQNQVGLRWRDEDPDSNARISLFYRANASSGPGTLLSDAIEDKDGVDDAFSWNLTYLPDGIYTLFAVIQDDSSSRTVDFPHTITLDRTPPVVTATPPGGAYAGAQQIILSANEEASIFYILDGTLPTSDSLLYLSPIPLSASSTLRFLAEDKAGNSSDPISASYTLLQKFDLRVQTDSETPLKNLPVHIFTGEGSDTQQGGVTNEQGVFTFPLGSLAPGNYKFRVSYLGQEFWTPVFSLPGTSSETLLIPQHTVPLLVQVQFDTPEPLPGIVVSLCSSDGTYLGQVQVTDGLGQVYFTLPEGGFKARVEYFGYEFWSEILGDSGTTLTIPQGKVSVHVDEYQKGADISSNPLEALGFSGLINWKRVPDHNGAMKSGDLKQTARARAPAFSSPLNRNSGVLRFEWDTQFLTDPGSPTQLKSQGVFEFSLRDSQGVAYQLALKPAFAKDPKKNTLEVKLKKRKSKDFDLIKKTTLSLPDTSVNWARLRLEIHPLRSSGGDGKIQFFCGTTAVSLEAVDETFNAFLGVDLDFSPGENKADLEALLDNLRVTQGASSVPPIYFENFSSVPTAKNILKNYSENFDGAINNLSDLGISGSGWALQKEGNSGSAATLPSNKVEPSLKTPVFPTLNRSLKTFVEWKWKFSPDPSSNQTIEPSITLLDGQNPTLMLSVSAPWTHGFSDHFQIQIFKQQGSSLALLGKATVYDSLSQGEWIRFRLEMNAVTEPVNNRVLQVLYDKGEGLIPCMTVQEASSISFRQLLFKTSKPGTKNERKISLDEIQAGAILSLVPSQNATITLYRADGLNLEGTELTDGNGNALYALPPGDFFFRANKGGLSAQSASIATQQGQTKKASLVLAPAT